MSRTVGILLAAALTSVALCSATGATDPGVERLLKKLPPPEKIVRPVDPIVRDPLAQKTIDAFNKKRFPRALSLSRELTRKYPKNAMARGLHGWLALDQREYPEASSEFRIAVTLEPKYSFAYFGLGVAEAAQFRYASALHNFQKVARLEPNVEVVWIASSGCAERLGRRQDSLSYARRATEVAPKSGPAWLQLARAEAALGHAPAARKALARAQQLGAVKKTPTRR